jgi:hypothetical protein
MIGHLIDFEPINATALASLERLLPSWLPGGRRNGNEFVAGSLQGETGRSLSINLSTGVWKDFAGDMGGSDPVSLYAAIHNLGQVEAARKLAGELGIEAGLSCTVTRLQVPTKGNPSEEWQPILPVPENAPAPNFKHPAHGVPVTSWTYLDGQGRMMGYVNRYEPAQGRKEIIPLTYCQGPEGSLQWRWKSFPAPRPLYGLDRLEAADQDAAVMLVEGEKSADAAQHLLPDHVCMTWPGGSKAVAKADFSPLAGRRVTIWPDADKPGFEATLSVAAKVKETGTAGISIISPPDGVAKGWDLADAEAEGWTPERVKEHIQGQRMDLDAFEATARDQYNIKLKAVEKADTPLQEKSLQVDKGIIPPPPPPPLDVFPTRLQQILVELSTAFSAPVEIAVAALLAMVSACIGRARGLVIKRGWVEHANLFLGIVARSGCGKSPLTKAVFRPVERMERKWQKEYFDAMQAYINEHEEWKVKKAKAKKDAMPFDLEEPKRPIPRECMIDDATVESLTDILAFNSRGILWSRDELAGLLLDMDKYGNGKEGGTKTRLMTAYDCGSWKVSRINNARTSYVPHACLSIWGTIQPDTLKTVFTGHDRQSGFLSRFMFIRAVQQGPSFWSDQEFSDDSKAYLEEIVSQLFEMEMDSGKPRFIGVTRDAKNLFVEWCNELALQAWLGSSDDEDSLLSKLRGQTLRLCLILHLLRTVAENRDEMESVGYGTMDSAIRLARWILEHQRQVWSLVKEDGPEELPPFHAEVAKAILSLEGELEGGFILTGRVTDKMNEGKPTSQQVTPETVGKAFNKLGLDVTRTAKGRGVRVPEAALARLRSITGTTVISDIGAATAGLPGHDGSKTLPTYPVWATRGEKLGMPVMPVLKSPDMADNLHGQQDADGYDGYDGPLGLAKIQALPSGAPPLEELFQAFPDPELEGPDVVNL